MIIGSGVDPAWPVISSMRKEIVLPLLWGQEGFPAPNSEMIFLTNLGLSGPRLMAMAVSAIFVVIGLVLLLTTVLHMARKTKKWAEQDRESNDTCTASCDSSFLGIGHTSDYSALEGSASHKEQYLVLKWRVEKRLGSRSL